MRKIIALMLVMCAIVSGKSTVLAAEENYKQEIYLEEHYQVNFCDVDVYIVDGREIIVEPEKKLNFWNKQKAKRNVKLLEKTLEENEELKENIVEELQSGEEVMAVSVTETPVVYVDNHAERVATNPIDDYALYEFAGSDFSKNGKFYLYTIVSKSDTPNANGTYDYFAQTKGGWIKNSWLGGSDYPDEGEDVIIQTVPDNWIRKDEYMEAFYDNDVDGKEGKEFWFTDGEDNYIVCQIKDDPAGWRQNTDFVLVCTYAGNSSNSYRKINSYYVHTWANVSVDVSLDVSSDSGTTLHVDPSKTSKSWKVYNSVTFDF